MNLPEDFLERMKQRLGERFPAFLRSYGQPPARGLRVNTLKITRAEFEKISPFALQPVPWEKNGYYVEEEKAGGHIYHFAGLYYCQEPSAMCAAPLLEVKRGERVLDLCAAPGGKTTQLAQALAGEGILIANEYVPSRAAVLSENVERLGVKNCAVVCADTALLAEKFPAYFDKILVDAPCSGEGMFRKDPAAVAQWSEENVRRCALRQAEILDNAAKMLRGGGRLVYSTCTFSEEENGLQMERFLREHKEFVLIEEKRLYPHEIRGEGHFAALLEKRGEARGRALPFPVRKDRGAERAFAEFRAEFFAEEYFTERITVLSDGRMFALPEEMPDLSGIRVLRAGIELGEWNGKFFKPAHALVTCSRREELARYVSLSHEESERYLRGETFPCEIANGWCAVGIGDYPLGLAKCVDGVLKNHYPKGLRKVK